jgi:hypothetical protein
VARAKKTDRSEARRRYREATGAAQPGVDGVDAPAVPAAAMPRDQRGRQPASSPGTPAPARGGFLGTMRRAAGPADIRGDLRALPRLLIDKAFLIPAAVIVGTAAAMMIPGLASNQLVSMVGNVILQPPPMIIAFLAGMLAPRGAWLLGGLVSVLAGIALVVVVTTTTDSIITTLGFTYVATIDQKLAYARSVFLQAPVFGIAVGAFAGFYRRFLNMSQPQRQQSGRR